MITFCTLFDSNYMDKQMVQLIRNFSKQRIAHVKEIVRYLYPVTKASYSNAGNEGTKYTPSRINSIFSAVF